METFETTLRDYFDASQVPVDLVTRLARPARVGAPLDAERTAARFVIEAGPRGVRRIGFAARDTYSSQWAVSTWLYRALTNVCIDELRRRRSRTAAMRASAEMGPHHAGAGTAGERVDVERALAEVPREARVLLALHYVDGLSFVELARVRGISVNTVKSQLARGKTIMRDALERGGRRARRR